MRFCHRKNAEMLMNINPTVYVRLRHISSPQLAPDLICTKKSPVWLTEKFESLGRYLGTVWFVCVMCIFPGCSIMIQTRERIDRMTVKEKRRRSNLCLNARETTIITRRIDLSFFSTGYEEDCSYYCKDWDILWQWDVVISNINRFGFWWHGTIRYNCTCQVCSTIPWGIDRDIVEFPGW